MGKNKNDTPLREDVVNRKAELLSRESAALADANGVRRSENLEAIRAEMYPLSCTMSDDEHREANRRSR